MLSTVHEYMYKPCRRSTVQAGRLCSNTNVHEPEQPKTYLE